MSSKRTLSGALGFVFLAAALWSGSAMAAGPTPAGIKADGLRWQAMADFYKHLQSPTPAGIKADGLRWQAIARAYGVHTVTTPSRSSGSGFDFGAAGIGALAALGLAVLASGLMVMARRIRRTKLAVQDLRVQ
jgi:hypothetical protein